MAEVRRLAPREPARITPEGPGACAHPDAWRNHLQLTLLVTAQHSADELSAGARHEEGRRCALRQSQRRRGGVGIGGRRSDTRAVRCEPRVMAQRSGPLPDTVLLVDDEPSVLDVVSRVLTRSGLTVKTAKTAEEAIALLDTEAFGAVVTDKNLPQRSGLDVVRAARQKQPYCACVIITGFVSAASALEALQLGANDYILKPFDDLALVAQRIHRALEVQRTEAERAALARMLAEMSRTLEARDDSLRAKEEEVFQTRTELDLFTSVMDLRVEEATRPLLARVALLESDVRAEVERRAKLARALVDLAARVRAAAGGDAQALEDAARALEAEAGALR